ncbi:RCC1/BLIP-II, partial [Martensiomyces pterosporus]
GFGINRCKQLGGETRAPTTAGAALLRQTIEGKVVQIACGREHSAILVEKNDGTRKVVMCGGNAYGQLGFEPHRPSETPELQTSALRDLSALSDVLAPAEVPVKIQCGLDHTAILTSAGRVFAMGWGADGQLGAGAGSTADHAAPVQVVGVDGKQRIVDISSTTDFTLALTEDSTLYYWGNAEYGQCMTGEKIDRVLSAMRVPFSQGKAASIAAGGSHALVLDSCGRVHVCGYGALGLGPDTISVLHPAAIKGIEGVTFIAASTDRCLAIDDERRVYSWGLGNTAGRLGNGTVSENAFAPQQLDVDPELVDPQL